MNDTTKIMGMTIKKLRQSKGMTQTDLASLMGYKDKTGIAKIETGKVDLTQSKIIKLSEIFGVAPAYFFSDVDDEIEAMKEARSLKIVKFLHTNPEYQELYELLQKVDKKDIQAIINLITTVIKMKE